MAAQYAVELPRVHIRECSTSTTATTPARSAACSVRSAISRWASSSTTQPFSVARRSTWRRQPPSKEAPVSDTKDPNIAALLRELEGYVQYGRDDRAEQVRADLKRRGYQFKDD